MTSKYVHGYDHRENTRLQDQASTLVDILHHDTSYPAGSRVLEVGCGVGAQTITLAKNSPDAFITSIDISATSIHEAEKMVTLAGITNVHFQQADIFALPHSLGAFDHIFVCFVLEHLPRPVEALMSLKTYLNPGGTIAVIEGDHGSVYFHPDNEASHKAIEAQIELQRRAGGNAMIGRTLYPLLLDAGYTSIQVSPRMVYVDASKPRLVEGFTKKTFTAMIEGIGDLAISTGIIEPNVFEMGIKGLYRTAKTDGIFCYTFFKAIGKKE